MAQNRRLTGIPHRKLTAREKSRNHAAAEEANIRTRRMAKKGTPNRGILMELSGSRWIDENGKRRVAIYSFAYHATKGLRKTRIWG